MATKSDPLVFAAVVVGAVALGVFAASRLRQGARIVPQGSGRLVGGGYVSGVVDPYSGRYLTGEDLGRIDWAA